MSRFALTCLERLTLCDLHADKPCRLVTVNEAWLVIKYASRLTRSFSNCESFWRVERDPVIWLQLLGDKARRIF